MRNRTFFTFVPPLAVAVAALGWYVAGPVGRVGTAEPEPAVGPDLAGGSRELAAIRSGAEGEAPTASRAESFIVEFDREYARSKRSGFGGQPVQAVADPLILVEPDSALGLDPQQRAAFDSLRRQFIEAVGGPGQDPADPEYLDRWEEAKPVFDDRLRAMLGSEVYESLERTALAESFRASVQGK